MGKESLTLALKMLNLSLQPGELRLVDELQRRLNDLEFVVMSRK